MAATQVFLNPIWCRRAGRILRAVLSQKSDLIVDLFAHSAARRSLALPIRLRKNLPGRATLCGARSICIRLPTRQSVGAMDHARHGEDTVQSLTLADSLGFPFLAARVVPARPSTCQPPHACAK